MNNYIVVDIDVCGYVVVWVGDRVIGVVIGDLMLGVFDGSSN